MDAVRFGRVLGVGARAAAKTVVAAVDAASAPSPTAARGASNAAAPAAVAGGQRASGARAAGTAARSAGEGLREGTRRFGREVWSPFVRLSGVLWLEVTGVFFGIFALFAGGAAWKLRGAWHGAATNTAEHQRLLGAIVMLGVFGYFCVSSFARARRRGRAR